MMPKSWKPNFAFRKFFMGVENVNIVIIFKILLTMPQKIRFIKTESTQNSIQGFL